MRSPAKQGARCQNPSVVFTEYGVKAGDAVRREARVVSVRKEWMAEKVVGCWVLVAVPTSSRSRV
jgi:hypothetical protein